MFKQLDAFLHDNKIHEKFQSSFIRGHNTKTVLVKVINDLKVSADNTNVSILELLDLSAAFDTANHRILLNRLENWIGHSGTALNWFNTYLTGRRYFVSLGDCVSNKHDFLFGIPQGSNLDPLQFYLYMLPLGEI